MEIAEGNKLIDDFLPKSPIVARDLNGNPFPEHLPDYNYWWPGLMDAVEHIESIKTDLYEFSVVISQKKCRIERFRIDESEYGELYFIVGEHEKRITATWQAVVAFIQWYNEQNEIGINPPAATNLND